ncbi:DNA primase [Enterococcus sp. HY326]|uniref:DNA primase n=1 Tax=Enterococcus sp. HY326 TaxID=2971265 RepID=UPI00223EC0AB|nr:DNA primase [Enterococcus sp. HY326]
MASRIPDAKIDEIRQKTNIVEVIGQYVQLKKSGKNYLGLCPFHNEKSPSFSVAEDKQIFHCFGCGKGGNVFGFIQEIEGLSFPEAVVKVAELENLPIDQAWQQATPREDTQNSQQRQLIELHEKAQELYHHMLMNTKAGAEALEYLYQRGLTKELITDFKLGFAPLQRIFLAKIFENETIDPQLSEASGLFVQQSDGNFLDRFYQRIMFPIQDFQGRTIGFSGRLLPTEDFSGEDQPKYLNSPETVLFNKRDVLYNFAAARPTIRKTQTVFLFEGFMDVISAWQSGVKNGIASMGTSLTNQQIAGIQRVAKQVVIAYDGDAAGVEATNRGIQLLQSNSRLDVTIVSLPEKLDPDEYRKKYGDEALAEVLLHGQETVFTFKKNYLRHNRNMQNEKEQLEYIEDVLTALVEVSSPIEQDRYLTQLAQEFNLGRDTLQQQLRLLKETQRQEQRRQVQVEQYSVPDELPTVTAAPKKKLSQVEKAEQMLLYRLFNEITVRRQLSQVEFHFAHDSYQELYVLLEGYLATVHEFVFADFLDFLKDPQLKQFAIEIAYLNLSEESSPQEIHDLLQVIAKASIADEINQKKRQQQEASQKGNRQLEVELQIEIFNLIKQLKQA